MSRWGHNELVAVVFAVGLSLGVVFNTATTWLLSIVAALLLVLSLFSIVWPLRRLSTRAVATLVADQPGRLQITGHGLFGELWLHGVNRRGKPVWGRVEQTVAVTLPRGVYATLPQLLQATDWFGWWRKAHPLVLAQPLVVGPRQEKALAAQLQQALRRQQTRSAAGVPGFELIGLRPYVAGDPMQAIDWKATARTGAPITRQTANVALQPWQLIVLISGQAAESLLGVAYTLGHSAEWASITVLAAGGPQVAPDWRWYAQAQTASRIAWRQVATIAAKQPAVILCDHALQTQAQQALGQRRGVVVGVGPERIVVGDTEMRRVTDADAK